MFEKKLKKYLVQQAKSTCMSLPNTNNHSYSFITDITIIIPNYKFARHELDLQLLRGLSATQGGLLSF